LQAGLSRLSQLNESTQPPPTQPPPPLSLRQRNFPNLDVKLYAGVNFTAARPNHNGNETPNGRGMELAACLLNLFMTLTLNVV
jgi:hypothetical protein